MKVFRQLNGIVLSSVFLTTLLGVQGGGRLSGPGLG